MATMVGMPHLNFPSGDGGGGGGILGMILNMILQRRQEAGIQGALSGVLGQAQQPSLEPSPTSGIPEEAAYQPPLYYPTGPAPGVTPGILMDLLRNPKYPLQSKLGAMKILESIQPQKKEFLTLGPGQEAIDITTKERIKGPAPKQHWQAVQGEENFWLFNPETAEFKETNTPIKGKKEFSDPEKDEEGNLIQKNLKTGEVKVLLKLAEGAIPKTRELKHGKEFITQEFDPKAKTWKEIARGPRKIEEPGEELKATKAKEIRNLVNQRFGLEKDIDYDALDEPLKHKYNTVFEEAQKYSHTMDTGAAVNRAMKESKKILYEREPVLNPETKEWEWPKGKGYTERWKYQGEETWRGPEKKPEIKQLDEATARAIIKEAAGDKNKAREIAKQRGYKF